MGTWPIYKKTLPTTDLNKQNKIDLIKYLLATFNFFPFFSICTCYLIKFGKSTVRNCYFGKHSVESPSTVDPQWDIWYWGSKWNLHTVCWSAVGCEWGTTSVYFGITYVCFIHSRLPVFAVEPQYLLQDFLFLSKVSFEGHIQNLQKISCWFKILMGFVGPKFIKLWTSFIWGFF